MSEPTPSPGAAIVRQLRDYAMYLIDAEGRVASWNEGVREIFGWDENAWIGQPASIVFCDDDVRAGVVERELEVARSSGSASDDRWLRRRDGTRFYASGILTRVSDDAHAAPAFLKVVRDCTASHRLEEERERLLVSEAAARQDAERTASALTAAIDAIPDAVYIGDASGISRCNRPALEMLGARDLEELSRDIPTLARRFRVRLERDGPVAAPEDLPFARALAGETVELDTWATRVDTGEDVFIRGTAAPIRVGDRILGAVAVNSDQTERLTLQQQRHELARVETVLAERDEQLRAVFAGVRDHAIFTVGIDGRISSWHVGAALMKGYTDEEAIGMPFANLFTAEERERGQPEREMEIAARHGEYKGEGTRLRRSGETFTARVVLSALRDHDGELLGYIKLTQDVTERKREDAEREEALRAAHAARESAERLNHSKDEFLATISHELRTPLGAILGWAHVLERGIADPGSLKHGLAAITRNARVQVQLIDDLLDMNRIESGQVRLEMQLVDPALVISNAIEAVLPAATAKGIAVRTFLDPVAGVVSGDPERLQQIVWNLLSNAVKFTPAEGRVEVTLVGRGNSIEIGVKDNGQGISAEFLGHVFDRFRQQDSSTTRRTGGLGLGLAIVRQLVELHGGTVRAESRGRGQGAVFTVLLPALAAPRAEPPFVDRRGAGPGAAPDDAGSIERRLEGTTVLVIDDEPDGRAIAAHVLQVAGAGVFTAAGAVEALELVRRHRPDVILCDIGMPDHDGYEFLRWVRSLDPDAGGRTPAAAFTAYARTKDRDRALRSGYEMHLVKPVEPTALVSAVETLAGRTGPEPLAPDARRPR